MGPKGDTNYRRQQRAMLQALEDGGDWLSPSAVSVDYAGKCECPRGIERRVRPDQGLKVAGYVYDPPFLARTALSLDMDVACRRCPACLRRRAWLWRDRAASEIRSAARTWFGTLTFSPDYQQRCLEMARKHCADQGVDLETLSEAEQFAERCRVAGREVTDWLKRVRFESDAPLRYLLVAERHTQQMAGAPHYHILLHESDASKPVRHRVVRQQWRVGFSRWVLANEYSAGYICKYLAKDMLARVRASVFYGCDLNPPEGGRNGLNEGGGVGGVGALGPQPLPSVSCAVVVPA